jgi:hypothetical protein
MIQYIYSKGALRLALCVILSVGLRGSKGQMDIASPTKMENDK